MTVSADELSVTAMLDLEPETVYQMAIHPEGAVRGEDLQFFYFGTTEAPATTLSAVVAT